MVVGILLAAGGATRFGANKILHPLSDDECIGQRAATALANVVDHLCVVVPSAAPATAAAFQRHDWDVVVCPRAHDGMAYSLRCGIERSADAEAWLIALADMPFIAPATLRVLAQSLRRGSAIVVPEYAGRRGHPVGFSARFKNALSRLEGDVGANGVLAANPDLIEAIAVDDPGILLDINEPADLVRIAHGAAADSE